MKCRQAKKICKAAVAYAGGKSARHRFRTVANAMRRAHWGHLESWLYVYECCDLYSRSVRKSHLAWPAVGQGNGRPQ